MGYEIDPTTGYTVWKDDPATTPTPSAASNPAIRTPSASEKETARKNGQKWVQGSDGFWVLEPLSGSELQQNRVDVTSEQIQADLDRRSNESLGTFKNTVANMDLGGQFGSRGTTPSEYATTTNTMAANAGVGAGGFTGGLTKTPRAITAPASRVDPNLFNKPLSTAPGEAPSKVEEAADQAGDALGPAPRVDMGLADRRLGEYEEALGMSREVIDKLLNGPSTAERLGSQTLRSQLALARSAAGGPGAVAGALRNAQNMAPELQATATEQARQEELSKLTAAGNVASNFAQAALGARGQDVEIASKNVDSGLRLMDNIASLTGTQLELDQRNQELIGQMARDLAALDFDWGSLDAAMADKALEHYLTIYGIDENVRVQLKALKQAGKISAKDIFNGIVGIVGSAATIGAAAAGKPPT